MNDGFIIIFRITKILIKRISIILVLCNWSKTCNCFQNSKIAIGKSIIVVELCHTIGTNFPKYIFFKKNKEKGSGIAKQKNRPSAMK